MTRKLFIKTYGCQMNFYDSGRMAENLSPLGFEQGENYQGADMVILNTCHIREKAAEKMYSELGRIRKEKDRMAEKGKRMIIAVAGCVGQAEGEEIFTRAPFVDMVVGPQSYQRLPQMVNNALSGSRHAVDLDFSVEEKFDFLAEESKPTGPSAFLTIQEGCDKFCSFCVVPYTRGAEVSRSVPQIYREALQLIGKGAQEIYLLGQNVNGYHGQGPDGDPWMLGKLIYHLADIPDLKRIRYTTSHPLDMHDELYNAHANCEKLMPFLHLPVQSGSNAILKAMNRKHARDDYFRVIDRLREARSDLAFSSDFIVGFPGETDQDFKDTMDLVARVGYAQCYSFKYSMRPGTPAANQEDQVEEHVKEERLAELQALLVSQATRFNESKIGQIMPVLFDREGKLEGQLIGKSPYMQSVYIDNAPDVLNTIQPVYIEAGFQNSLKGRIPNAIQAPQHLLSLR